MTIYKEPLYYEIAFSFINPKKQLELFEGFIKKFSKIKVKKFLDIGCGPSLQLMEIAKKDYEAIGLDISPQMLEYLAGKSKKEKVNIKTIKADMRNFNLKRKVDFAFIMMGTINYFKSNQEFLNHLDSVANSLKKGGLYLIENLRLDWSNNNMLIPQTWVMIRDNISVKTTYIIQVEDTINQILKETIILEVNDNGKNYSFKNTINIKLIFPQEFLELVKLNNKFEFLGWFERNKMKKLKKASMDNIILLRRK